MSQDYQPGGGNPLQRLIDSIKSGRVPLPLIGGLAAVLVIGIIVAGALLSGGGDDGDDSAATDGGETPTSISGGLRTPQADIEATADLSAPTAQAENLTQLAPGDKVMIPEIGVDASLTYRAVGTDGVMPNPDGPDDIAYYDFSAWPGKGGSGNSGNIVLAGHVDSGSVACKDGSVPPPCTAVLWDLNLLGLGDEIQVQLNDTVYTYTVTSNEPVSAGDGPWDQIVASTEGPTLTIITCGGDFNRETGEYTDRQVLKGTFAGETPA